MVLRSASSFGETMYVIAHHVGRLIETRIWGQVTMAEAVRWVREARDYFLKIQVPPVCFMDLIDVQLFPQDVSDVFLESMRGHNGRSERVALLVGQGPTVSFQIRRMVMEADESNRRIFKSGRELEAWLGEVMTQPEQKRIREAIATRTW